VNQDEQIKPVDLRLVGRSEDNSELELTDSNGGKYNLRISDTLRATLNQPDKPRLAAVVNMEAQPNFTVKDIQARLRSGESIDAISRTTDWSQEKIEKFAGPILQERAYIIQQAEKVDLRRDGKVSQLGEIVFNQLSSHGVDMEEVEWNTHRNLDGSWSLVLHYQNNNGATSANWTFEPGKQSITAVDDNARWIIGEVKSPRPTTPTHGLIYPSQTPAPRLVAVREEVTITRDQSNDVVQEIYTEETFTEELEIPDESDPVSDGISSRPKLPSWDDIMFGGKKDDQ
jgi:Protein of unknown function (DUF3071)